VGWCWWCFEVIGFGGYVRGLGVGYDRILYMCINSIWLNC
jgi:hypothetical protein